MSDVKPDVEATSRELVESTPESVEVPAVDRWDRRFRIEGDAAEALKVVLADRLGKDL